MSEVRDDTGNVREDERAGRYILLTCPANLEYQKFLLESEDLGEIIKAAKASKSRKLVVMKNGEPIIRYINS